MIAGPKKSLKSNFHVPEECLFDERNFRVPVHYVVCPQLGSAIAARTCHSWSGVISSLVLKRLCYFKMRNTWMQIRCASATMSIHSSPFWRRPRPAWWSDPLPVPRKFCLFCWERPKHTDPGQEQKPRWQTRGQTSFCDRQNIIARVCLWLAWRGIFRMPSGEIIKVQIPPPRHWVAPGPGTCDRFINFICPQVMAPSTSTAPASWQEGQGRCLYQTSLKLNAPVRLPEGTWPVLIWGLQVVADIDRWTELGSPRHLLYITRPLYALWLHSSGVCNTLTSFGTYR